MIGRMRGVREAILLLTGLLLAIALAPIGTAAEPVILDTTVNSHNVYLQHGKPTGFVVDLVTEALARTGRQVEFRFLPWARCLDDMRNGHADGVLLAYRTSERESYLAFSEEPLILEEERFFVRKDASFQFTGDLTAFKDRKIGILNQTAHGQIFETAVAEHRLSNVESANSYENLMRMLINGRVDAVLSTTDGLGEPIKEYGYEGAILPTGPPLEAIPSYLGFSRARALNGLRTDFDAAIRALHRDGTFDRLRARHYEMD